MVIGAGSSSCQNGTAEEDHLLSIWEDDSGSVIIAGHTKSGWSHASAGKSDFAAVKLDNNGKELWRWQVTLVHILCIPSTMICLGLNR